MGGGRWIDGWIIARSATLNPQDIARPAINAKALISSRVEPRGVYDLLFVSYWPSERAFRSSRFISFESHRGVPSDPLMKLGLNCCSMSYDRADYFRLRVPGMTFGYSGRNCWFNSLWTPGRELFLWLVSSGWMIWEDLISGNFRTGWVMGSTLISEGKLVFFNKSTNIRWRKYSTKIYWFWYQKSPIGDSPKDGNFNSWKFHPIYGINDNRISP